MVYFKITGQRDLKFKLQMKLMELLGNLKQMPMLLYHPWNICNKFQNKTTFDSILASRLHLAYPS